MAQHFLLSRQAKTLSLAQVFRLSDEQAETAFRKFRWAETDGSPVCPECGSLDAYDCRRPNGAPRFRCRECRKDFSITSGTMFASHKMPLRMYLTAIAIFVNEVKGKAALAMSRDLGTAYKTAFVLCHKLREAMAEEMKDRVIGDDRPEASVDGAVFGGYVKPKNYRKDRKDRRLRRHQSGKRQWVVAIREHGGETLTRVFRNEADSHSWISERVVKGTILHADEAASWNALHGKFDVRRINHEEAYSHDGACTNWAESFFRAFAAPRSAIIIISRASIFAGMLRKPHGARIIAVRRMASRSTALRLWRWLRSPQSISAAIGSDTSLLLSNGVQ